MALNSPRVFLAHLPVLDYIGWHYTTLPAKFFWGIEGVRKITPCIIAVRCSGHCHRRIAVVAADSRSNWRSEGASARFFLLEWLLATTKVP